MLDTAGFNDLRSYIKRRVSYARDRVGSAWTKVYISEVVTERDGTVRAKININSNGQNITVNRVELYNTDSELWAHADCSLTVAAGQTGISFWFDFNIKEEVA